MKFSDNLNDGLVQKMDQNCGTDVSSYPYKEKCSDINSALDRYFVLAFKADNNHPFDDKNNTGVPISTQTLTSGTNAYKMGDFLTDEILNILRVEISDSNGYSLNLIQEHINSLNQPFYNLYSSSITGIPAYYLKYGDYLYVRPTPDYTKLLGIKIFSNRPSIKFSFKTVTMTIATPAVFSCTSHGLSLNDQVILRTDGILPTGLTAETIYFVISAGLTTDAFELSTTQGGSAINTTGSQSGNHSFLKVNGEPGIPSIHHDFLHRYASLQYCDRKSFNQSASLSQQVAVDEKEIIKYFANRDRDVKQVMTTAKFNFR